MNEEKQGVNCPIKLQAEVVNSLPLFYQVLAEKAQDEGLVVIE